jgi:hypothetical protein
MSLLRSRQELVALGEKISKTVGRAVNAKIVLKGPHLVP